jgi:hypothetical protein
MCIVASPRGGDQPTNPGCPAQLLTAQQRRQLALDALAGQPIAHLAARSHVSRKFVYQQLHKAHRGLDLAFADKPAGQEPVLFYLPVTRSWLRQLVLGLALICHSPLRGACELLADVFDFHLSLGCAHNILQQAVVTAEAVDLSQGLSAVRIGALDEIFQSGDPVLVGADVHSTYCYLLSQEKHRDGDTWGVRLLELRDRGFDPEATIADFGTGLRRGQEQALPDTPCRGDIFHPLRDFQALLSHLDGRAYQAIARLDELRQKQARFEWRHGRKSRPLVNPTTAAKRSVEQAVALAEDVAALLGWLRQDILAISGPEYATRAMLYDWVVAELQAREGHCDRIGPIRHTLQNRRDELLLFAGELDSDLRGLADHLQVPVGVVREALAVRQMDERQPARRQREELLSRQLGGKYAVLCVQVEQLAAEVVRASSVIENLNSRLRNYFSLRKQVGPEYLKLLKFYLNHRRFTRSEHPQREGKSPRELLTGQGHPHWLELLGYQRFRRQ